MLIFEKQPNGYYVSMCGHYFCKGFENHGQWYEAAYRRGGRDSLIATLLKLGNATLDAAFAVCQAHADEGREGQTLPAKTVSKRVQSGVKRSKAKSGSKRRLPKKPH